MNSRARLWYLYDFANSFASVVFVFYFPLLFVEIGGRELIVGLAASFATLLLLAFLPPIGRWADGTGKRIPILWVSSVAMSLILVCLAFLFDNGTSNQYLFIALYVAFQFCFQGSVSIYSSLLNDVAQGADSTVVSGKGVAFGQLGNAVALAAVGPIVSGGSIFIGLNGKPLALFVGALLSFVLALPFLIKSNGGPVRSSGVFSFSYKQLLQKVVLQKPLLLFLIGTMLVMDAILTFQIYLTLYASKVFGLSDTLVTLAGITALVFCIVGAVITKRLVHRIGSPYSVLRMASGTYGFAFLLLGIVPASNPALLLFTLLLLGISYGVIFTTGRVVYASMTPADEQSEYFSLYTLFERAASLVGPVVWVGSFWIFARFGEVIQYRGSVLILMLVAFVGFGILTKGQRIAQLK